MKEKYELTKFREGDTQEHEGGNLQSGTPGKRKVRGVRVL